MKAYSRTSERPALKHFKMAPKYPHLRSEGLARRTNAGSSLQPQRSPVIMFASSEPTSHGYIYQDF